MAARTARVWASPFPKRVHSEDQEIFGSSGDLWAF